MHAGYAPQRKGPLYHIIERRLLECEKLSERSERERRERAAAALERVKREALTRAAEDRLSTMRPKIRTKADGTPTVRSVVLVASMYFGRPFEEMLGPRRYKGLAEARHVAMYVAQKLCTASFPAIGRVFDRDHTSILHGVAKIQKRLDEGDVELKRAVDEITDIVKWPNQDHCFWGS